MSHFSRAIRLFWVLVGLLATLIVLPAVLFGVVQQWQVVFLALSYLVFFLGTIWRAFKYGKLSQTSEDEQYKRLSGRLVLVVQVVGLFCVHWFALYDFSYSIVLKPAADNPLPATVAILLIAISIIINQVAIRTLKGFFDRMTIKPDHRLIKTGIYSKIRHPIYLSYILLFAGFCTLLQSFVSLGLLALVCTIWLGNRIQIEEEMLETRFGKEYKAYQQKTKKLFPFIY